MLKDAALAALALLVMACAHAPPPKTPLPENTMRDVECVIDRLSEEKKFDDVEAACMPGQEKRLVIVLALLEVDESLLQTNAIASAQSSIDLHEIQRRGLSVHRQEKK